MVTAFIFLFYIYAEQHLFFCSISMQLWLETWISVLS